LKPPLPRFQRRAGLAHPSDEYLPVQFQTRIWRAISKKLVNIEYCADLLHGQSWRNRDQVFRELGS
jgi:hypothetical protein